MALSFPSLLNILGVCLIIHSAYSCLHFRSLHPSTSSSLLSSSSSKPPLDVTVEVLLGFVFCMIGQLQSAGEFLDVRVNAKNPKRELRAPSHRTRDFDTYNTRMGLFEAARRKRKQGKTI